ncbi:MAG: TonB-dependent receptor [Ignavibacteriaceae bacterium]|nr:TonB-dependent receptor [Ignavibacteriaceae bacterium]
MKNLILMLVLLCITNTLFAQGTGMGKIVGEVIDHNTKQPIPAAVIEVVNYNIAVIADSLGNFLIENLPPKTYHLKISAQYYVYTYKTDIQVSAVQSSKVNIELKPAAYVTEEVIISSEKYFDKPEDLNVSTNSLSPEEIRRAPGAAEDLNRMIQTLPGVTTATDSRNDLIVRGGSPAENLILIDGIEVPNINHFGTQGASGGPIGMLNVDFLNEVTFSAGGFSAKYGDKLSSAMDIQYRNGDKNSLSGKLDVGIAGGGLILEGPIQQGKSSFLFSARKSYLDLILKSTGLTAVPNYSNFNLKATYDLSESHKLTLIGLAGIDKINLGGFDDEDDPLIVKTDYSSWQAVGGIVHKWLIGSHTYLQTSLSTNQYQREIYQDSLGRQTFKNESLDAEYSLRTDLAQRFSASDLLEAGTSFKYIRNNNSLFLNERVDIYGGNRPELDYSLISTAYKTGSYIQYTKTFFGKLNIIAGLRHDYFNFLESKNSISPRLAISYHLFDNLKINGAWGIYYQAPPLIWLVSYDQNKKLKQIKANQIVLGTEYYPSSDVKVTVEYFDKKYSDYPNSIFNPQVTYANAGAEYQTLGLEPLVPASNGYARGVELFIQKKLSDNFYGMFNYSYSTIKFTSLDGVERSSSFDYKNVLTIILGYKIFDNLEISGKFRYLGGKPYTPLNEIASAQLNQAVYNFERYNTARQNDYQRFDFRVDYKFNMFGWNITTFIDFENLFNKKNIDQIIWNQKQKKVDYVYQWSFLPAGGVKIEF